MTDAELNNLLQTAHERGRADIVRDDVRSFLAAKRILQDDPKDVLAKEVVSNFLRWMSTGVRPDSFAAFMLPIEYSEEEIEARARRRAEHLAYLERSDA